MSYFIAFVSLLSDWLLFSFPLYQGLMELNDYQELLVNFDEISGKWKMVSPWWWLIPVVKIQMERTRGYHILREATKSKSERHRAISFIDKATAWYFVALAGWLKMIASSYELLEAFGAEEDVWILLVMVIVMTAIGLFNAYYRISKNRVHKKEEQLKPSSEVADR
ncbi:hypothetical protein [Bifidobacterium favimelis]|uniref:DUF4328 domain-containing protein n=1 Tax=Bifidobacterium favimelis TaxID=3122979 RepID=A0ABU8ZPE0_9BIFI